MSNAEDKNLEKPVEHGDNIARARLFNHLAYRGYVVVESDALGPVRVFVNGMDLQEWERDSVHATKAGKVRDFVMKLVGVRPWLHK